ncbi:unnamed protein product [Didymodactylos carnosus]|uniref:BZIP domain-containing protein n=1 Tax=Didymodactylos carnosus TaxID=1234261 RepID=A0A814MSP3_9BILA|nr:unnamed protein product [Didymodactylos carnosus]CAF1082331.1 unnamed protein product [Didymodactylos carnosus]CAF3620553.1 unnamed protein product [Didymodactylos carnosus]CAF3848138.1 unnamed protein product [Didymodactylos carnosus]
MNQSNRTNSHIKTSHVHSVDLSVPFDLPITDAYSKVSSSIDPIKQIEQWLKSPSISPPPLKITQQPIIMPMNNDSSATSPTQNSAPSVPERRTDQQPLAKSHVRYGPITVNPRTKPAKTLFTGRKSKYEVLSSDEEEKRRLRRERNRIAATKCREKREDVIVYLEKEYKIEVNKNKQLKEYLEKLIKKYEGLKKLVKNHSDVCQLNPNQSRLMNDQQLMYLTSTVNDYLVNTSTLDDNLPSSLTNSIEEMSFGNTARTSFSDVSSMRVDYNTSPIASSPHHYTCTTTNKIDEINSYPIQISHNVSQLQDNFFLTKSDYLQQQNQSLLPFSTACDQQQNYDHSQSMTSQTDNTATRTVPQGSLSSVKLNLPQNARQIFNFDIYCANNLLVSNCARQHSSSSEDDSISPTLTSVF